MPAVPTKDCISLTLLIISIAFILVGRLLPVTASVRVALPCMVLAMACMRAWRQHHD